MDKVYTANKASHTPEQATSPAVPVAVEPDGVHDELQTFDHWVVWMAEQKEDAAEGFDKVLYSPHTGRKASSTDSRTWATFAEAVAAYIRDGWDGIGFVFSSGDPFTGIDLDKVRNPDTGELVEWAQKIIDALDGYVEISPSGKGIHIYIKGELPTKEGRKGDFIEAYSMKRFFTVTGVQP